MIKLPNKIYQYNESIISKFPIVMDSLKESEISIIGLYSKIQSSFVDIDDFIETLTCLYALNKIEVQNNILKIKTDAQRNQM